jgi:uncharacterized membrane protein YesL
MTNNDTNTTPAPQRAPSVQIALRTLGRTLRHGYEHLGTLAIASVFWYLSLLLILPIGVTTAALHRVTRPMTEERSSDWREFWAHVRTDVGWSSGLMALLVFGFILLPTNIRFYNSAPATPLRMLAIVFSVLLLVWTCMALYAFPIALRQEEQRVWRTIRNAIVMTLANLPGALVSVVLLALVVVLLLLIPPLFLLIPGVVALWGQENARLLLVASGYVAPDPFADRRRGQE